MKRFVFLYNNIQTLSTTILENLIKHKAINLQGIILNYFAYKDDEVFAKFVDRLRYAYHVTIYVFTPEVVSVPEYLDWLGAKRDLYDYVIDRRKDVIAAMNSAKLPIMPLTYIDDVDTEYNRIAIDGFSGQIDKLRALAEQGIHIHLVDYATPDLFKYVEYIDSADSSDWSTAGKYKRIYETLGKTLLVDSLNDNASKVNKVLQNKLLTKEIDRAKLEAEFKVKDYRYVNYYNLIQFSRWISNNTKHPKYKEQVDNIVEGKQMMPEWAMETDKLGRPKERYLASRFNRFSSGVFAKKIQEVALVCNNCAVRDVCPMFRQDATCYFLPYWKKFGKNLRDKDALINLMENIIADKYVRYQRAMLFESLSGGYADKQTSMMEADLIKALELLDRVKYGTNNGASIQMLAAPGSNIVIKAGLDESLQKIRSMYGEELAKKIERRINEGDNDADKTEDTTETQ